MMPGWIAGKKHEEIAEQAEKLLQDLGLGHRINHLPTELWR